MGKYRAVLPAFIMAVMVSLALGGCATAPSPAKPPAAGEETDWRDQYDVVGGFSEGRAWVVKDGKWFHILLDGTPAYEERYDYVGLFLEGRARVEKDGEWYHIDALGTPAYPERYYWVDSFYEGRAGVEKDGEWFYIDPNGKRIEE